MTTLVQRAMSRASVTALTSVVLVSAAFATTTTTASAETFRLSDHPNGNQNPPPYGVRLDNLFVPMFGAANGGVTTFSLNHHGNTTLTATPSGPFFTIDIAGTVRGGVDTGGGYGFGAGDYDLDFSYVFAVPNGTGYETSEAPLAVSGTLTAGAGIAGIPMGTVFNLSPILALIGGDAGFSFRFLEDNHRLVPGDPGFNEAFVGRGWLDHDGATSTSTSDFLFLGTVIPLPSPAALGMAGLAGLVCVRRRR